MILDGRWEQHHRSWPRTLGAGSVFWLKRRLKTLLDQLDVRRLGTPESCSIRAGMRPSQRRCEQMCLKERSCTFAQPGYAWENVSFARQVVVARAPSAVSEMQGQHGDAPTG